MRAGRWLPLPRLEAGLVIPLAECIWGRHWPLARGIVSEERGMHPGAIRMRRLRPSEGMRRLTRETALTCDDLIQSGFVVEGTRPTVPIASMPDLCRMSADLLEAWARSPGNPKGKSQGPIRRRTNARPRHPAACRAQRPSMASAFPSLHAHEWGLLSPQRATCPPG
jgi:hypothetical protein